MYLSPLRNLLQSFLFASNSLNLFCSCVSTVFLVIPSLDDTDDLAQFADIFIRFTLDSLFFYHRPTAPFLSFPLPSSTSPPNGRAPRAAEWEEPPPSSVAAAAASAGAAALPTEERGADPFSSVALREKWGGNRQHIKRLPHLSCLNIGLLLVQE